MHVMTCLQSFQKKKLNCRKDGYDTMEEALKCINIKPPSTQQEDWSLDA
jgi:hypothetical protein